MEQTKQNHTNSVLQDFLQTYSITPFQCPFSALVIALFIYYTSVPSGTEARTEVK